MIEEIYRKRHDTREPIPHQATQWNPFTQVMEPVDLTATSGVVFKMRPSPNVGALKVNAPASITDPTNGWMLYQQIATDMDTTGDFVYEYEAHFNDGTVQTFPTENGGRQYNILHVVDDLD